MTERKILERTYFDRAIVFRRVSGRDEITKQTKQTEERIAGDLPCALSRNKSGTLTTGGGYGQVSSSFTLFCAPDAPVLAGDRLEVTTKAGQRFVLWAGDPLIYADSHSEIPLSGERRT